MQKRLVWNLVLIFGLAIIVRFWNFYESVYFAYDQARDLYTAQKIYKQGDIKLIGPPVSGATNLFHGVMYWYMLVPVDWITGGDPIKIAMIYRVINALGVLVVFAVARKMFSKKTALIAALVYAVSFEQTQYAMYVGNPTLGGIMIVLMFIGVIWQSAPLVFSAAALALQFNLMYVYSFVLAVVLGIFFRLKKYKLAAIVTMILVSSFVVAEVKYDFRGIKSAVLVLQHGYNNMTVGQSRISLYWDKYLTMYADNLGVSNILIILGLTAWLVFKAKNDKRYRLLTIWIMAWVFLMLLGGHTTYYTNAGLGVGVIIFVSSLLAKLKKYFLLIFMGIIVWNNLEKIYRQAPKSLISGLAAQEMMKLADEYRVIDRMYQTARGEMFTVRQTGIPYKIQTLWAYLFNEYGLKKYGYNPYWENGNTLGFPGSLPMPQRGSTCWRFRLVEPKRGLPQKLIDDDEREENYFSEVVRIETFGEFYLETRRALECV